MSTPSSGGSFGGLYASRPPHIELEDCIFYHRMDLPGIGPVGGQWDLRDPRAVDAYLGGVDVRGKRVLELGTASGSLCFAMESRGAEVVAYDLSPSQSWDIVPYAGLDVAAITAERRDVIGRINNAWWFAHGLLGSGARLVHGTIYEVPGDLGPVDVATFGSVLLHVRDPFLALQSGLRLTRQTAIVSERISVRRALPVMGSRLPVMTFLPDGSRRAPTETWWAPTPAAIRRMLGVLGFGRTRVRYHLQSFEGHRVPFFTVVGTRTEGAPG